MTAANPGDRYSNRPRAGGSGLKPWSEPLTSRQTDSAAQFEPIARLRGLGESKLDVGDNRQNWDSLLGSGAVAAVLPLRLGSGSSGSMLVRCGDSPVAASARWG